MKRDRERKKEEKESSAGRKVGFWSPHPFQPLLGINTALWGSQPDFQGRVELRLPLARGETEP